MKVLDLFSGLGGWSQAFNDRCHDVTTLDFDEKFNPDICINILDLDLDNLGYYDIILASPPCDCFSVMTFGNHWDIGYRPKTEKCKNAIQIIKKTIEVIETLQPQFFIIENPIGMLRKLNLINYQQISITYCQYGTKYMKPTDLWGKFPTRWVPRPMCKKNNRCHVSAKRNSRTGIQSDKTSEERAIVPYILSKSICLACEKEMELGPKKIEYW